MTHPALPNRPPCPPGRRSRRLLAAAAGAATLAVAGPAPAPAATDFHAVIDGAHARVPNNSPARGVGHFVLDDAQEQLGYQIAFDPWVTTTEIAAHIHLIGTAGGGSDVIIHDLPEGALKVGVLALELDSWRDALFEGRLYVNVHTQQHVSGEIAGTIVPGTPARPVTWGRVKALYLESRDP